MKNVFWVALGIIISANGYAHEMIPTYPKLKPSFSNNILYTTMELFNRRSDVRFYEIGVFDQDFNPLPFVTSEKVIEVPYLGKKIFDVYIREQDRKTARYICSTSRIEKKKQTAAIVYSKICSKLK